MLIRFALYPAKRGALQGFAPSASPSGRRTILLPQEGFSSRIQNIAILNTGALNYVEFMAEREGFEPSIPF